MYCQRFGLKDRPFPATPDVSHYYPATSHERALAQVERALADDDGFALVTGAPGTGKTLVGRCLLDRLGEDVETALLTNSHCPDRHGLLQAILFDLSLPYDGTEQSLRLRLTDHLLQNAAQEKRTVLMVDEAQHLAVDHLEELRLLGNLEAGGSKAFQVILIGQTSLLDHLRQPELKALSQRIGARAEIQPLGIEEALDYLMHHLRWAGGRPEAIFEDAALEALARGTHGVPRLLNQAAHQAITLADANELELVDTEAALESLALLGLETAPDADQPSMLVPLAA